jgi:hypothetical protein
VAGEGINTGILAAIATLVATAFALSTFDRWQRRRQPHELAWTIAMTLFAIGSFALWVGTTIGWTMWWFRIFFLAGAVLNVAWLALGTIYLLAGTRIGNVTRSWLIGLSCFASGVVLASPAKIAVDGTALPTGREVFGAFSRALAALGSGVPALIIIGGALWSAARLLSGRPTTLATRGPRVITSPIRLALGNLLIAAGTLVLSGSGSIAGRFGKDQAFAITLTIGVCVLFVGFLVASNATARRATARASDYVATAIGSR